MPKTTQYQRGTRKERELMKELEAHGWPIVLRTAGSHGPFDVIAIDPIKNQIELIQVKYGTKGTLRKLDKRLPWPASYMHVVPVLRVYEKGNGSMEWRG